MISWLIARILIHNSEALTPSGLFLRFCLLTVLFGVYLLFFVLIIMRLKKKRIQKMTALILTAVLIVEASVLIHSLRGRTHVPLEYVCAVDTSRNDHHEKYDPIWRTNCFPDTTKPVPKELLEHFFECDLTGVDFDENYTYLFVYYYKDVDLTYSFWDKGAYHILPASEYFWIGNLSAHGKDTDHTVYVFRFPQKRIVSDGEQWIV